MPVVDVRNLEGKAVGQVELNDAVFAAKVKPHLLHEASRWYLNAQRAGTHKVKGRSEVAGSGKKLWRQKGTGRARMGSIRSPLWRKGGTVHGPRPRKYDYALPHKMVVGALRSALSAKLADQKLTVVDSWSLESHKTKPFRQALDRLDGDSRTILLVDVKPGRNLQLASRNLKGVKLVETHALQAYDLLRHDRLMVSKDAALKLSTALAPKGKASSLVSIQGAAPAPVPVTEKPRAKAKAAKPAPPEAAAAQKKPRAPRKTKKEEKD
jgi:large subunit ribosomal protein L4